MCLHFTCSVIDALAYMLANVEFCLCCVVRDGGMKFDTDCRVGNFSIDSFVGFVNLGVYWPLNN